MKSFLLLFGGVFFLILAVGFLIGLLLHEKSVTSDNIYFEPHEAKLWRTYPLDDCDSRYYLTDSCLFPVDQYHAVVLGGMEYSRSYCPPPRYLVAHGYQLLRQRLKFVDRHKVAVCDAIELFVTPDTDKSLCRVYDLCGDTDYYPQRYELVIVPSKNTLAN